MELISEINDEDFTSPTHTVGLLELPANVCEATGGKGAHSKKAVF